MFIIILIVIWTNQVTKVNNKWVANSRLDV